MRAVRKDRVSRAIHPYGQVGWSRDRSFARSLFAPERLSEILSSLESRRAEKEQILNARITSLEREVSDAEDKLKRLYKLVEDGLTDLDDVLKDRLNALKAERDRVRAALERARSMLAAAPLRSILG